MSDLAKTENDFKTEPKFKQFTSAIEKALKSFEGLTEWHDLISSLTKLNKVLLAYMQYNVVPLQLTVCKRLAQCLHPNLPSGVHLKTLNVYAAIFKRIGPQGLLSELFLYSSGLFPLLSYASMSVRPRLLDIYEKHFIPLGIELTPTLHGFVLGLLPGLEDESEHKERICVLLEDLSDATDNSAFFYALWQCIYGSPDYRLPAINLLLSKLNKKLSAEDQVHCMGGSLPLVVCAVCEAMKDKNVLVQRTVLDIVCVLFPFHQSFLLPADLTSILTAALQTLLKRDISLSRRFYAWLLGTQVQWNSLANCMQAPGDETTSGNESDNNASSGLNTPTVCFPYFEKYSKSYLDLALKGILVPNSEVTRQNLSECLLPYRLLRTLVDRPEISESVMECTMLDLVVYYKHQVDLLGGISAGHGREGVLTKIKESMAEGNRKRSGKKGSLKADIIQSANLLLGSLGQDFVWKWMEGLLQRYSADMKYAMMDHAVENNKMEPHGSDPAEGHRPLSPVSDILKSALSVRESPLPSSVEHGVPDDSKSFNLTAVLKLLMFLTQVVPKDSVDSVHVQHISQLLVQLTFIMKTHQPSFSLKELNTCHKICLCLLSDLLQMSSSSQSSSLAPTPVTTPASTPASTPVSTPSDTGRGLNLGSVAKKSSPEISLSSEEVMFKIYEDYMVFFSSFLDSRVILDSAHPPKFKDVHQVFTSSCQALVLIAKLISKSEIAVYPLEGNTPPPPPPPPPPPSWLTSLMSVCQDHTSPNLALVALETVLTLVEMVAQLDSSGEARPQPQCRIITSGMVDGVVLTVAFVKSVTELMLGLLSFSHSSLHIQVASLLVWLHSLLTTHNSCEMVILEQFASQGLGAYQVFTILWQYMPNVYHRTKIKPFYRAVLRMLEGLQSSDAGVRSLAESWVKGAIAKGSGEGMHSLLQPLVKILLESNTKREQKMEKSPTKKVELSRKDAERDKRYAKYYFESLGIENPYEPSKKDQYIDVLLHYTQVFDGSQILYALSLLKLVVSVDPSNFISVIGNTIVDVSIYHMSGNNYYGPHQESSSSKQLGSEQTVTPPDTPSTPQPPSLASQKSLLEVILSIIVDLLRSEYHPSLKASPEDLVENLKVKISSSSLLSVVLNELLVILADRSDVSNEGSPGNFKICSPNFVSALVTLCDIQKVSLLLLGKSVEWWMDLSGGRATTSDSGGGGGDKTWSDLARQCHNGSSGGGGGGGSGGGGGGGDPGVILKSFYTHLLRVVQCLIALDTQFNQSLPIDTDPASHSGDLITVVSGVKLSSSADLPPVYPSCAIASQPFFKNSLLQVLSDLSLSYFHDDLLCMFASTVSNLLGQQLIEIAPKVVKQLCSNIEKAMAIDSGSRKSHDVIHHKEGISNNVQLVITYFDSILSIISWCFFGDTPFRSSKEESHIRSLDYKLHHRSKGQFFNIIRVKQAEGAKESLSPSAKQPSTMAWIWGVFSTQKLTPFSDSECTPGGAGLYSRVGINSLAGQKIAMLLPAVCNAITDVWVKFCSGSLMNEVGGGTAAAGVGCGWGGVSSGAVESESVLLRKQKMVIEDIEWLFGQFLCTLAMRETITFFSSVSHIWLEWNLDDKIENDKKMSKRKTAFIDLLHHVKVLPLDVLLNCLQSTLSDIMRVEDQKSSFLRQKYLLHFLYKYISSTRQSSKELAECRVILLSFLREYHNQIPSHSPQALLNSSHILCMLTSILHVLVCRVAPPDKAQKKERRELQDVTHKLCETLSMVADVSITPPDRAVTGESNNPDSGSKGEETEEDLVVITSDNGHTVEEIKLAKNSVDRQESVVVGGGVKGDDEEMSEESKPLVVEGSEDEKSASVEVIQPIMQALAVLSNVLAHFIDYVFGSSEKDKVASLLKVVLANIWPHLHNHSSEFHGCFTHSSKLLASLSGFQVTRKSWRKEVFDLFLADNFFVMSIASLSEWKVVVDNLMTQDQVTFRDLLTRLHSTSASGVVNLFSSLEQEVLSGNILLKRMAFAILSGEVDQYVKYLPDIQEKLSEYLKVLRYPSICCEVLLAFRVLLLKFSPHYLVAFWPAMTAELLSLFSQLEADLQSEISSSNSPQSAHKSRFSLYLAACKLLDTALALPPEYLPHFQWLQWGFMNHGIYSDSEELVITRLCKLFKHLGSHRSGLKSHYQVHPSPPYLQSPSISSLRELKPLFDSLVYFKIAGNHGDTHSQPPPAHNITNRVSLVEDVILQDFLESRVM